MDRPTAPLPTNKARALFAVVLTVRVAVPLPFVTEIVPTAQLGGGELAVPTLQLSDTSELLNPLMGEMLIVEVDGCPGVTLAGDMADADKLKSALTFRTDDALASKSLAPP